MAAGEKNENEKMKKKGKGKRGKEKGEKEEGESDFVVNIWYTLLLLIVYQHNIS